MRQISICSPSYKRAGKIKIFDYLPIQSVILYVHEFESKEYLDAYGKEGLVKIMPDDLQGSMGKVRNFILDNAPCNNIVMVDDDVKSFGYHEDGEQLTMEFGRFLDFLQNGFDMCQEAGTVLWGVNMQSDPKFYREYSPFSFLSPVLGPFCCHIRTKKTPRYDERLGLNEDYDFALQVLKRYHKILRFNKYYYMAGQLTDKGGCGAYRLLDSEKEQAKIMQKKWGEDVVHYNFDKSTNPELYVPLKGI